MSVVTGVNVLCWPARWYESCGPSPRCTGATDALAPAAVRGAAAAGPGLALELFPELALELVPGLDPLVATR